jgi:hypothetical protein
VWCKTVVNRKAGKGRAGKGRLEEERYRFEQSGTVAVVCGLQGS